MRIQAITSYELCKRRSIQKVSAILKCQVLLPDWMSKVRWRTCARPKVTQSGAKPSDTFKCAIYRLQTTRRFAPSLPAKFWAILRCHFLFPVCACAPPRRAPKPSDTFGLRSIACKRQVRPESARKVLGHSKMPASFSSPRMRSAQKCAKPF